MAGSEEEAGSARSPFRGARAKKISGSAPLGLTDGSLSSASNLAKLLPIDTVLTFQSLLPFFSNCVHGVHHLPHYSQGDRIGSDSQYRGRINLR
ncbi:unnamed protein product [Spirodela intermedia]|uniref:Uncharacterized protein n=1 Tax=Spirodela intermedia TaxID=51605 RepID=A0A7I8JY55_SPIIN|nr:unnamed protein product [Spirodela intermedia]